MFTHSKMPQRDFQKILGSWIWRKSFNVPKSTLDLSVWTHRMGRSQPITTGHFILPLGRIFLTGKIWPVKNSIWVMPYLIDNFYMSFLYVILAKKNYGNFKMQSLTGNFFVSESCLPPFRFGSVGYLRF